MPASTDAVSGISYGWSSGESGWANHMDANLLRLGLMSQIRVLDRNLTAAPGSAADGEIYIVGPAATGAWAGKSNQLAVFRASLSAWEFYEPQIGWVAAIVDEEVLSMYKATGWSAGLSI